jgi:hypothetical protein
MKYKASARVNATCDNCGKHTAAAGVNLACDIYEVSTRLRLATTLPVKSAAHRLVQGNARRQRIVYSDECVSTRQMPVFVCDRVCKYKANASVCV